MKSLYLAAGPKAYAHIQKQGLSPSDIDRVVGASGAAKWLTIYGLDKAIFTQWLSQSNQIIDLIGTSIGAYKLAATAQKDPAAALTQLAESYINQTYPEGLTPDAIEKENQKVLSAFLSNQAIEEILDHPRFRFHCAAVKCKGALASSHLATQKRALLFALAKSAVKHPPFKATLERIIFSDPRSEQELCVNESQPSQKVDITSGNFQNAIMASGAIPVYMNSVNDIEGAGPGIYRDGGLLDYHPVPNRFWKKSQGITLYPHFYRHVKPEWFDKFYSNRKATALDLSHTLIVAPSEEFVASLPGGRIPAKEDFQRHEDHIRIQNWQEVVTRSEKLGAEFIDIIESGRLMEHLQLIYP